MQDTSTQNQKPDTRHGKSSHRSDASSPTPSVDVIRFIRQYARACKSAAIPVSSLAAININ